MVCLPPRLDVNLFTDWQSCIEHRADPSWKDPLLPGTHRVFHMSVRGSH